MTRKAAFYYRAVEGSESLLGCPECGQIIDHIPSEWLNERVGHHVPCPNCSLDSRIPSREDAIWPDKKDYGDSTRGVPIPEREQTRMPNAPDEIEWSMS